MNRRAAIVCSLALASGGGCRGDGAVLAAAAIGGVTGGWLGHETVDSDPTLGAVGFGLAGALVVGAVAVVFLSSGALATP